MITKNTQQLAQEVKKHIDADSVIQRCYWENGKGCFVGCLAQGYNLPLLSETYGLPIGLTRICEAIFEALSLVDAKQFFADFPSAIGYDGKNISLVEWQFLEDVLKNMPTQETEIQSVIDPVIVGMGLLAKGEKWDIDEAAVVAIVDGVESTSDVVRSALQAVYHAAYHAAGSARIVKVLSYAATAHRPKPSADEYKRQRDVLLELIRQAV